MGIDWIDLCGIDVVVVEFGDGLGRDWWCCTCRGNKILL